MQLCLHVRVNNKPTAFLFVRKYQVVILHLIFLSSVIDTWKKLLGVIERIFLLLNYIICVDVHVSLIMIMSLVLFKSFRERVT